MPQALDNPCLNLAILKRAQYVRAYQGVGHEFVVNVDHFECRRAETNGNRRGKLKRVTSRGMAVSVIRTMPAALKYATCGGLSLGLDRQACGRHGQCWST